MKTILFFLACSLFSSLASAQESKHSKEPENVFVRVEVDAQFPGGDKAWVEFLTNNLNTEIPIKNKAPKGKYTVVVRFVVSRTGALSDIMCERDPGYGTCKEVIRVIKKSGNWLPAQQNGKTVNAYRRQPVTFVVD
ncbi:MAG TPA: hypothetical protein VKH37_03585 [Ferruginibacter sp.]|nr:hypothetical protein [Ferruginibacter sp.]